MPINNAKAEAEAITDEFGFFDDWEDRYQMLIDQVGNLLQYLRNTSVMIFASEVANLSFILWLSVEPDDKITFMAQSDAAIVQGLVALLLRVYSGRTAKEILETEPDFLQNIGLDSHLSVTQKWPCQHVECDQNGGKFARLISLSFGVVMVHLCQVLSNGLRCAWCASVTFTVTFGKMRCRYKAASERH